VVGTVRIHQAEPGVWWGSRLAVDARYRKVGALGAALIKLAVSSAHARGCRRFLANVQSQNGLLFRRMRWSVVEEIELLGLPHLHMEADLDYYPPFAQAETGFRALPRKAA
jgi:putative N-acetyltransferase (TIGR04045 family)